MPTILILEDDINLLDGMVESLAVRCPTLECHTAQTLDDAAAAVRARHAALRTFTAMVVDLGVPGAARGSHDALVLLHTLAPTTPKIVWTGWDGDLASVARYNALYYIVKGRGTASFDALVRALEEVLHGVEP
jgi:hypothetical protein